jgi:pimeloyl-ACP methyl ester carboxylesterase
MLSAREIDPVLLLHGQPGGARDWDRVRAAIGAGRPTVAIDRPGWDGRSAPADIAGNARAALRALDAAGIERATVAGHSLGAAVGAWLAAFHRDRVGALVLVSPAANLASLYRLDYLLARPLVGYAVSAAALGGLGLALTTAWLRRRAASAFGIDERYLAAAAAALRAPGAWRAFVADQRSLVRDLPSLEQRLDSIEVPTTIVAGDADRVVPVSAAHTLARQIPGAELVLLEGAGHLIPLLHAERLAAVISAA